MDDLYKDDPNSWLRRTRFSNAVYHQPDPSQITVNPLTKNKFGSSNLSSNWASISVPVTQDNTSNSTQTNTVPSLKSDAKTKKKNQAVIHGAIFGMFKEVKKIVRSRFMGPLLSERTVKSSSSQKKKNRWMKKYFGREVRQVGALDKSREDGLKKMASCVCCPIQKASCEAESGLQD